MNKPKIGQAKEKDFDSIVPRWGYCDMNEQTKDTVVNVAREACKRQHDGEDKYFKDMAIYVKKTLDKELDGSWHIIVGKSILYKLQIF